MYSFVVVYHPHPHPPPPPSLSVCTRIDVPSITVSITLFIVYSTTHSFLRLLNLIDDRELIRATSFDVTRYVLPRAQATQRYRPRLRSVCVSLPDHTSLVVVSPSASRHNRVRSYRQSRLFGLLMLILVALQSTLNAAGSIPRPHQPPTRHPPCHRPTPAQSFKRSHRSVPRKPDGRSPLLRSARVKVVFCHQNCSPTSPVTWTPSPAPSTFKGRPHES